MRVEYAAKALSDLRQIAAFYNNADNPILGAKVACRVQEVVRRIAGAPESGRPVTERPGVRVAPLLDFRYNLFYFYISGSETLRILHIRHTSRRPWTGDRSERGSAAM